jgi:hypothetical protein
VQQTALPTTVLYEVHNSSRASEVKRHPAQTADSPAAILSSCPRKGATQL